MRTRVTVLRCGHAHVVCLRDLGGRDLVVDEVARTAWLGLGLGSGLGLGLGLGVGLGLGLGLGLAGLP